MLFLKELIRSRLALLFAGIFLIGTIVAGCNGQPREERLPEEPAREEPADPYEEPAEEPEEEPFEEPEEEEIEELPGQAVE